MSYKALFGALLFYGLFSSPTPDVIGWAEWIVGAFLVLSVGFLRPVLALLKRDIPLFLWGHRAFLVYMLCVPVFVGVLSGNHPQDMIRDLIPVFFLILPLCFYSFRPEMLVAVMAVAGGLLALRYIAVFLPFVLQGQSLLYLANAPMVSFATIIGFHWLTDVHDKMVIKRLVGGLIMLICFAAMAAAMQRAPLILSAAACMGLLGLRTLQKPIQSMMIGTIIVLAAMPFLFVFIQIFEGIEAKTIAVGWNNRLVELLAVFDQSTVWGTGWGGVWQSPAVGDFWVRYTHNIVSYYWLKAGVIGGIVAILFFVMWFWQVIRVLRIDLAIGLAVFVPFVVHTMLYTGFKTLDFALLLTVLTSLLCTNQGKPSASSSSTGRFRRDLAPQDALPVTSSSICGSKGIKSRW